MSLMAYKQNEKIEGSLIRGGFHTIRVITAIVIDTVDGIHR